ncbi:ankyrin repeat-containing domain protein [Phaeosphaeriaceae sp. PMI808]|nr:ankyrin repeat-containing domain protein [Phaeosphaeriaceae sp. PMI808]
MMPHAEADKAPVFSSNHHSSQPFHYSLDDFSVANGDESVNFLAPNFSDTSIDLEVQSSPSNWYAPTSMGIEIPPTPPLCENAYPSSARPLSHSTFPSYRGSAEAHYTIPRPSNTHSHRDIGAYRSPPPSDAGSSPRPAAGLTASASTLPSRLHHTERSLSHDTRITITHKDDDAKPPSPLLHVATRSRSQAVMQVLLRRGVAAIDERDSEGRTALHIAVELGDEVLVRLLLGQGADTQAKDVQGRLALHYAVEKGQCEVVEMLLDHIT